MKLMIDSILACSFPCLTAARRLALKAFMETNHPAGGSKRNQYFVCTNDGGRAPEGEPAIRPHTDTGEGLYQAEARGHSQAGATERLFWEGIGMSPSPAPAAGGCCRALPGRFERRPEELGTAGPVPRFGEAAGGSRRPGDSLRSFGRADGQRRFPRELPL